MAYVKDFIVGISHDFLWGSRMVLVPVMVELPDPDEKELAKPTYRDKRFASQSPLTYKSDEIPFRSEHEENRAYL